MIYRFFMHKMQADGQIETKLFEIDDEALLPQWKEDNPGWYDRKHKVVSPKQIEQDNKCDALADDSIELTKEQLSEIVTLLKGYKIGNRRGLTLTSFCNLFGVAYADRRAQRKLRPKYEKLLKHLDGEICKQGKSWYYNGVQGTR